MIFFSIALFYENMKSEIVPPAAAAGAMMIEWPEIELSESEDEVRLQCANWRLAVESNNLRPWKTLPLQFGDHVKDYMTSQAYHMDLERVSTEAAVYAKTVGLRGDGKDVWIFDIDETLLSNLPYYSQHGYGVEAFDGVKFGKWIEKGKAPVIEPCLKLYEEVLKLGFKVFLLAGRSNQFRSATAMNLIKAGYRNWDKLILRGGEDRGKRGRIYKTEKRREMEEEGYRIIGNIGDQWSDLLGSSSISARSFKLPNPMYCIP